MSFIKNIKVSSKLSLLVVVAAALLIVLGIIAYMSLNTVANLITDTYDKISVPMGYATKLTSAFDELRVLSRDLAITTEESENQRLQRAISEQLQNLNGYVNSYSSFLTRYNITSGEEHEVFKIIADNHPAFERALQKAINSAVENDLEGAFNIIQEELVPIVETMAPAMEDLIDLNIQQSAEANENAATTRTAATIGIIATIIISVVVLMGLATMIIRSIVKPVTTMVSASKQIAKGDFNISIATNSSDEIGELSRSMAHVMDIVNGILADITNMAVMHNDKGEIEVFLDEHKFPGKFGEVAKYTNNMVRGHIDTKKLSMDVLNKMAAGDFDVPMEKLPGKKIFINNSIEDMRKNIKAVGIEIHEMIREALKGNLSVRANANHFKGDWAEIMQGLNELLESIIVPVMESSKVLQEMSKGNFDMKVTGNFQGDLALLSNSLNTTSDTLQTYIGDISYILGEISSGNLDLTVDREYIGDFVDIKTSMNTIISKLNDIIGNINFATGQVESGARSISESSASLATGATEQASSIQELSATIDVINEQTKNNADSAKEANELSEKSRKNAVTGNEHMSKMLNAMESIKDSSNNISKVIKAIDDIAFQTNLLALNAAVEAARAGQYGKGFAVVAEEVRSLASRSQNAARETSTMIEESITRVDEGMDIAGLTAKSLETIVHDVNDVSGIISEIAESSTEQAISISQVTDGLGQISKVVQSNTATSEESAAASEELSNQSKVLSEMVAIFNLKKKV